MGCFFRYSIILLSRDLIDYPSIIKRVSMDRFALGYKIRTSEPINKEAFIQEKCRGKTVLDLGCIRHSAEFALGDLNWLHKKIKEVAEEVIGVDYLDGEIEKLQDAGYHIHFADVTKKIEMD